MISNPEGYSGVENLEAMKVARNYNRSLVELIIKYLNRSQTVPMVLDFGAGLGTFSELLRTEGIIPDCLEPDAGMAQLVRLKGYTVYESIEDIPDYKYDFIYSLNVLEHIQDDTYAVKAISTKLKAKGRFLVYVPAFPCLFSAMDVRVGHYRRYTAIGLRDLLLKAGLVPVEIKYADFFGFFASIAYKYFGNKAGSISSRQVAIFDKYIFPLSAILDKYLRGAIGKNIYCVCEKE